LDRECSRKLKRGEEAQYGKWLRWLPPKRGVFGEYRRAWGEGGSKKHENWGRSGGRLGSDAPNWRKDSSLSDGKRSGAAEKEGGKGLSLSSGSQGKGRTDMSGLTLQIEGGSGQEEKMDDDSYKNKEGVEKEDQMCKEKEKEGDIGVSDMVLESSNKDEEEKHDAIDGLSMGRKEGFVNDPKAKLNKFKRMQRLDKSGKNENVMVNVGRKRGADNMILEEENKLKRARDAGEVKSQNINEYAGLPGQLRESQ
jgi:hypothetical protein